MNLDEKQIDKAFAMGKADAQAAINNGANGETCKNSMTDAIHYYALKKRGD